jgi:hypothetical protein
MGAVICIALLWGCGGDRAVDSQAPFLRAEVVVEGLREAVQVDSVLWDARAWAPAAGGRFEISGRYSLLFRNLADQPLELRYDLRFLDRHTFLIDVFNPFGLPLRLGPREARREESDYFIRADQPRAFDELQTMQVRVVADTAKAGTTR